MSKLKEAILQQLWLNTLLWYDRGDLKVTHDSANSLNMLGCVNGRNTKISGQKVEGPGSIQALTVYKPADGQLWPCMEETAQLLKIVFSVECGKMFYLACSLQHW